MTNYSFKAVNDETYAVHYAVYLHENIFLSNSYNERIEKADPNGGGYLVYQNYTPIGGVCLYNDRITSAFLIPPFDDRWLFWQKVMEFATARLSHSTLTIDYITTEDADVLSELGTHTRNLSIRNKNGKRRMQRPTAAYEITAPEGFYFTHPTEADIEEITRVVYEAHLYGFTSTVLGEPVEQDISSAIARRFDSFAQTDTLSMGTIVKSSETNAIVAVCIAGIYPDASDKIATIHQVSVLPDYRGKGIAKAMILNSINNAHSRSPVITLGVMCGNPAETLYGELGFFAGPAYYHFEFNAI